MITDVPGIRLGHATDDQHHTGCTVILCPEGTIGGGEVRGPSPGSRETALLAPDKHVEDVTAILLTGGSAYGLAAADGVMRYCEEHNLGHWTPVVRVPIVPAAVVFDLFFGRRCLRSRDRWGDRPGKRGRRRRGHGRKVGRVRGHHEGRIRFRFSESRSSWGRRAGGGCRCGDQLRWGHP